VWLLVEFAESSTGLRCATEWQHGMAERNAGCAANQSDRISNSNQRGGCRVEDGDIFGDGVNVAGSARRND